MTCVTCKQPITETQDYVVWPRYEHIKCALGKLIKAPSLQELVDSSDAVGSDKPIRRPEHYASNK